MTRNNNSNTPVVLLKTLRSGIIDCQYYGSVYLANSTGIYFQKGFSKDNLFFIRSLAKPLQLSIIADNIDFLNKFNISDLELAIMQGSHAGSGRHIEVLKKICKKNSIRIKDLELEPLYPLDNRDFKGRITKLHNNCSGKHIFMILMCKHLGLEISGYTNPKHPLQKLIKLKQEELSGMKADILSFDGCSTPLWAISAKGIINSYYKLINDNKYNKIIQSALKYPDIFGGFNRLDTELIKLGKGNLYSKVGANGFVIVCNLVKNEIVLLKITQNNNPIRKLIALDILNKLKWIHTDTEQIEYNQKKQPVAKYCYEIQL